MRAEVTEASDRQKSIPKTWIFWSLLVAGIISAILTIVSLSRGQQTANEGLLLSILLTVFSIGVSWLLTHAFYTEDRANQIASIKAEHEENLRVYAVKAAEKVINLSNQISRLEQFLEFDNYIDHGGSEKSYQLMCERANSALHMLGKLRSMNDTGLSDWEGIIGDRLDQKRKIDEQRTSEVNDILEEIKVNLKDPAIFAEHRHEMSTLIKEINGL
jgi:uncharacterized protein YukE